MYGSLSFFQENEKQNGKIRRNSIFIAEIRMFSSVFVFE